MHCMHILGCPWGFELFWVSLLCPAATKYIDIPVEIPERNQLQDTGITSRKLQKENDRVHEERTDDQASEQMVEQTSEQASERATKQEKKPTSD